MINLKSLFLLHSKHNATSNSLLNYDIFRSFYLNSSCCISFEKIMSLNRNKSIACKQIKGQNKTQSIACRQMKEKNKTQSKKSRFPPSEIYLCVLGNGSISSSRALYMFTDHARYLFNCGEGTQRLAQEHKMKLSKLDDIFITHKSWENFGGLLGLSLTIQDMGVTEIMLHGPPDMNLLYKHTESFVFLKNLDIVTKGFNEPFCDDCMEVKKIPIFKTESLLDSENYTSDSEDFSSTDSDDSISVKHKSKKLRKSHRQVPPDVAVAFACKGHSRPGQLLLDKCVKMNVPPGPLLGDLKNGKDVVLPSGQVVLSKDVVSPEQECPLFLVVECPSEEFLDPFINETQFEEYQENASDPSRIASLVVHFTPSEILQSTKYQEWMQRFPSTTSHLILNGDCATQNSLSIHQIQHQLNRLHPGIFSLLHDDKEKKNIFDATQNVFQARTLERYYLRPNTGLDRSYALSIEPKDLIEEALNTDEFEALLEDLQRNIQENSKQYSNGDIHPEVTFLGTGSSIPSKHRNVSAILVKTSENECLLLDCGEGTYGQIFRLYGNQNDKMLLHLSVIFISHMHADHHLGLIKILKEREKVFKKLEMNHKQLLLIGPRNLQRWLKKYSRSFEHISHLYRFVECSAVEHDEFFNSHCKKSLLNCPDLSISTVPVNHCPDAHGVIISSESNWKLVYSGDTTPCDKLISAGKGCSLLIHEATMEDDLAEEAAIKRHCTTSEAIEVAKEMKSKYTLLTHFSQRYAKVPLFNENFHSFVGCAFDNMKVRPNELYILPLLIPALNSLFAENIEDLHTKTLKRRQKTELLQSLLTELSANEIAKTQ